MVKQTNWHIVASPVGSILSRFWKMSRGTIALVAAVVAGSSLISVSAPFVFSRLVDRLSSHHPIETIFAGFLLYAALVGASLTLGNTARFLALMAAENLNFISSTSFFERLSKKSPRFFIEHNPVEVQAAQTQGAQALSMTVNLVLSIVLPGVIQLVLTLAVLGTALDTKIAAVVLLYGAVFISLTYFTNVWTRPHLNRAISVAQANASLVGNAITSMETLRYFGSSGWMSKRFNRGATEVLENWRSFCVKRIAYAGVYGVALALQFVITFTLFLPRYRAGLISVGDIVLFNVLLLQLNHPFEMVGIAIENLIQSYARIQPFARMWAAAEEIEPAVPRTEWPTSDGRIEFRRVGFAYEEGRGVSNVSFTAARGAVTFLTGESGSGKSTVFKLALKAMEPSAGEILIDGFDLREIARKDWYSMVGVVPQEIMLLNDTLTANIVLGREVDETRLREAAARAAILARIEDLPDGFATVIGERGLKLSGGERQRVAIARALYGKPKLLFLDEASSALDEPTETGIMDHIRTLADEVTVLAITHRKSTIHSTDHVVDLKNHV
ncbi:ATM1-type heavy metal exporter [Burkholderia sp. AD24]|nr:ATM1-type heavy metal exporter [Burkholderia sp. AD24]